MEIKNMKQIQTEAKFINTSLSSLKRVINCLLVNKYLGNHSVPPFRESNLTKVLQESLSNAQSKLIIFVNIQDDNFQETKESLKFGTDAQLC
mmetsp:Transcript_6582/g.834  ORF Transcript_6582/g.834 Transcript_6582/m.834 type:complete len:92 (-) Transcript_6582:31-306(-)